MSSVYPNGTRILIELAEGKKYEGLASVTDIDTISISDVLEYPQAIKHETILCFDYKDIKSVNVLIDMHSINQPQPMFNVELIEQMNELSNKCKYITERDEIFQSAIDYLNTCSDIAVFYMVSKYETNIKISLLAIATKDDTFVFDIQILGKRAFYFGLRNILESDKITKIVLKSKQLAECLAQEYHTELSLIFDIETTDFIISHGENQTVPDGVRSLSEIITDYCNIPPNTIELYEPDDNELKQRPLSREIMLNSALKVAYMYSLKSILKDRQINMQMQNLK